MKIRTHASSDGWFQQQTTSCFDESPVNWSLVLCAFGLAINCWFSKWSDTWFSKWSDTCCMLLVKLTSTVRRWAKSEGQTLVLKILAFVWQTSVFASLLSTLYSQCIFARLFQNRTRKTRANFPYIMKIFGKCLWQKTSRATLILLITHGVTLPRFNNWRYDPGAYQLAALRGHNMLAKGKNLSSYSAKSSEFGGTGNCWNFKHWGLTPIAHEISENPMSRIVYVMLLTDPRF